MQIDNDLLFTWGAVTKKYAKNDVVFFEDQEARYYFQIVSGGVKMFNINDEGKEFTQGIFREGESFGEPPLFIDERYPASAVVIQETIIIKICKDKFFKILDEYSSYQKKFLKTFAQRIFNKANTAKECINNVPESRITGFLNAYKKREQKLNYKTLIPFTRQEIANSTGLTVETVIRTLCKMNKAKKVEIIQRKLYY